jgi:hypothetical protein
MTTLEVLKAAREKIADPAHWTKGEIARDKFGMDSMSKSPDACAWCAMGAIWNVSPNVEVRAEAFNALDVQTYLGVPEFNDSHTHPEVLALFDKAIAAEEAKAVSND